MYNSFNHESFLMVLISTYLYLGLHRLNHFLIILLYDACNHFNHLFLSICFEIVEKEEGAEAEEVEEDSEVAEEVVVTVEATGAVEVVTGVVEEEVVIVHQQTTKTEIITKVMRLVDRLHLIPTMNVIMRTTTGMSQILGYCMIVITLIVSYLLTFMNKYAGHKNEGVSWNKFLYGIDNYFISTLPNCAMF